MASAAPPGAVLLRREQRRQIPHQELQPEPRAREAGRGEHALEGEVQDVGEHRLKRREKERQRKEIDLKRRERKEIYKL